MQSPTRECAENAQQNLWLKLCRKWPLTGVQNMSGYMYRAISNAVNDEILNNKRDPVFYPGHVETVAPGPDPVRYTIAREELGAVGKRLSVLSPAIQYCAVQHWYMDVPVCAIAEHLCIPQSTVRSRLRVARAHVSPNQLKC